MKNAAENVLELMRIGVFNVDGTPKGTSELIKEIQEKLDSEVKNSDKTLNQIRKKFNLYPIEDGDQHYHKKL